MNKKDRVVRPSNGTFTVFRLLYALAGAMLLAAVPENNLFAQTDFGDAPESYGTLLAGDGARHVILDYDPDNFTSSLMLGSLIDAEPDGFPSAGADGDDADNADDEDAFNVMPPININSSEYTVEVPVHNSTGADAVLVGWIDFDRNGQFDVAEAATAAVADGQTTATLSWTGLSLGGQFGSTYARLRLAPADEIDIDTPTGEAAGGEVEDYTVPFVDLAPPFLDCPVTDEPPPTDFSIQLRWQSPDVAGQRVLTYQTPIVGDLFSNGQPVVVVPADNNFNPGASVAGRRATDLHLFNGADGSYISTIETPQLSWSGHAVSTIADVTGDGQGEIIVKANHANAGPLAPYNRRLVAYAYNAGDDEWNELWVSDELYDYGEGQGRAGGALGIADFNGDGVPEVYVGNQIFNARTGERLAARVSGDSSGCPHPATWGCFIVQSTAVDMDDDGHLELVAGNVVYKVDLDNPDPALRLTVWQEADPSVLGVGDGFTAVADMDLDGTPDVVVVRTHNAQQNGATTIYVWDGQTPTVKAMQRGGIGNSGGPPLIGDIDGDGVPEIVIANSFALRAFHLEPGTGLVQKWILATGDGSGVTSLAMFDFNKDQVMELVYRDEVNIRIIDGSGAVAQNLALFACTSGTGTEMPVIAALDDSRQARILATCGTVAPLQRGVVRAFETASFPWANTRPVWNQQAYFVTHINDDLSVPSNQFPHWTPFNDAGQQCSDGVSRPLNAFQQQVTDIDPNNGCPVDCAPALVEINKELTGESGEIDGQAEAGELLTYTITLTNSGGQDAENQQVWDRLDANVSFVDADTGGAHDGSATGGVVEWTGLLVPGDDFIELMVTVQVVDPIPDSVFEIGNVAFAPIQGPPDCGTDPLPPNCTLMPTGPNVGIAKTLVDESGAVDGVAEAGEILTYEITLTNTGASTAVGYLVLDQLDPNVTFDSADSGGAHDGSATGGEVGWTVDVPAADANGPGELVLTVIVQVVDPIPDGVTAIGNVAYNPDDGPPDCPDPACTEIPTEAQVLAEKSIIAESGEMDGIAEPDEVLTFSIRVRNTGGSDESDVLVNEIVPDDTSYVAAGSDVWSCADGSPPGTACDLVIPVVPAGGHVDLLFRVRVDDPILPGVVNIANSVALNDEDPPDCPPITDPACVVIPTEPQTVISKALTGENLAQNGQAEAGEVLTYTLTLHNHGGLAENNVLVNEIVPEHTVSATGNQSVNGALGDWSCADGSGPGAACDLLLDSIGPDERVELTFMVQVDDPIPDGVAQITNSVALNGEDPVPCPPSGPRCVITPTEPAVSVIKTLFSKDGEVGGAAEAGEILIYELTVTNSGGSTAFDQFLREIVPQHTTYVAPQSNTGWDCPDGSPNPAVCDLFFDIDGGQTLSFLFAVQVVDPLPDDVTRIANGIGLGGNPTPCPPGGVHCVVIPTTNLFISKALVGESGELDDVAETGETLTYAITLTNTGGAIAVDYPVVDQLDPNVIFVSANMGGMHDGAPAGGQVDWTVDVPAADDEGPGIVVLTVEAQVVDPIPDGVTEIGNVAYNPDFDPPDCDAGDPPPNCTQIPTDQRQAMLSIDKQAAPASFEPGGSGTYTLAVHVEEGLALGAGPVDVSDPMPPPLVISGEVIGSDWDCTASTDTEAFCIYIGAYPVVPGDRVGGVITIPFTVPDDAGADDNVVNVATVTYGPDQATADADAGVVIAGEDSPEPIAVPIDARWTAWLLVLMFLSAGLANLMLDRRGLAINRHG